MTEEMPQEAKDELEKIAKTTKRGFELGARLKNRGLRKATLTLYLDEELGPELGWVYDVTDNIGGFVERVRVGVVGQLDKVRADHDKGPSPELEAEIAKLEARRDELMAELTKTAIVLRLCAVPPIIEKDCVRKARATLGITEKGIPEDKVEDFDIANQAHLMAVMMTSITDNETGGVIESPMYEDAIDLMGYLPKGQYARLDQKLGELQFTDAISRSIEVQEDFS